MAGTVWEFFGYRAEDSSAAAVAAARDRQCPYLGETCEKRLSDGEISGVCAIKPATSPPVICCPIRLYADGYRVLHDVARIAFGAGLPLIAGGGAAATARETGQPAVAVFGKRWGGELRLPQKDGAGSYFVDWVLALLDADGQLQEFVAVEVQTIDTTGNYRNGREALLDGARRVQKTTAGLNWENVNKRILPQLIYKGQVLQREALCRKGLFFVSPTPVYDRIMSRLGGAGGLIRYALQPASITFLAYDHALDAGMASGSLVSLQAHPPHSTTVYKVQEAFNNVTLPDENVYRDAIVAALGARVQ
ncbi:MAG: NotI family restriction endonuclease [Acidovorax sp.]|uniref:NotI family restriction endonuclease n=1 Tax=Acidovorax sp. TaxID=1872122 RepID=UPI0039E2FFA5